MLVLVVLALLLRLAGVFVVLAVFWWCLLVASFVLGVFGCDYCLYCLLGWLWLIVLHCVLFGLCVF